MANKEMVYLKGLAKGKGYYNTLKAIYIAATYHRGQKRKSGEDYIDHPTRVTSELVSLNIQNDIILATAILHDVIEDCNITKEDLIHKFGIDPKVAENVQLLSKEEGLSTKLYYERLKNIAVILVKISDRCHNISTMECFSIPKIKEYIEETEQYVLPLCHYGKDFFPEYSDQIFVMKYHIQSVLNFAKAFIQASEHINTELNAAENLCRITSPQ